MHFVLPRVSCLSFAPREAFTSPYLHNMEAMGISLSHHLSDNTQYWQAWFSFVFLLWWFFFVLFIYLF